MNGSKFLDVLGGIVFVAALTTIFARRNSAAVITSLGGAFSSSISSALGKGTSF